MGNNRERVVHALHKILDESNSLSRCCAVKALATINACDDGSRRRLIHMLRDEDPDVRMDAAVALGELRVRDAVAPLLDSLESDPEGDVRIEAVTALSRIGATQSVDQLMRCVRADGYPQLDFMADEMEYGASWEVQRQAVKALGQMGDHRATRFLIELLQDEKYEDLQESGFMVLAQSNDERARAFLMAQLTRGDARAKSRAARAFASLSGAGKTAEDIPPDLLQALTNALLDPDAAVRISAVKALAGTRNPLIAVPVTMLLTDPDQQVRDAAATAVKATANREIIGRLHELLLQSDAGTQRSITRLLGEIGDPDSCQPLCQLIETDDPDLLFEVVRALGQIGLPGPEQRIASLVADENAHPMLRAQAAEALGHIVKAVAAANQDGDVPEAGPEPDSTGREGQIRSPRRILKAHAFDTDDRVSYASLAALLEAYPEETGDWLTQLVRGHPEMREKTGTTSESITDPPPLTPDQSPETSTVASILSALPEAQTQTAPGDAVRILAARLLGNLPDPEPRTIHALSEASRTGSPQLRREALLALAGTGDETSLPAIIEGLESHEPGLKLAAMDAAGNLSSTRAIEDRLETLCKDPEPGIRSRALQVISSVNGPAARQCLYDALEDDDPGVSRTALRCLTGENSRDGCAGRIVDLMCRFSGELRAEGAATLQRIDGSRSASRLLALLNDAEKEEIHWICIDALAELCGAGRADTSRTGMTRQ